MSPESGQVLYLFDTVNVLLHGVPGYAKLAGYPLVGAIEVIQIDDSSYLCHRFHPNAHLLAYFGESGLSFLGGQKRIGVSLYRGVKIESVKTGKKAVL